VMDRGVTFISQGEISQDDGGLRKNSHDNAHQIASQSKATTMAAFAKRSATLCSSKSRWSETRRG